MSVFCAHCKNKCPVDAKLIQWIVEPQSWMGQRWNAVRMEMERLQRRPTPNGPGTSRSGSLGNRFRTPTKDTQLRASRAYQKPILYSNLNAFLMVPTLQNGRDFCRPPREESRWLMQQHSICCSDPLLLTSIVRHTSARSTSRTPQTILYRLPSATCNTHVKHG